MKKSIAKHFKYSNENLYAYLDEMVDGMNGELVLELTPATTGSSAAAVGAGSFTRDVEVKLVSADGTLHTWFNGEFAIAVVDVTAGDGSTAISGGLTEVVLTEGKGTVTIEYSNTWAADDTNTLTVTGGNLLGYAVSDKTSIDTLVA